MQKKALIRISSCKKCLYVDFLRRVEDGSFGRCRVTSEFFQFGPVSSNARTLAMSAFHLTLALVNALIISPSMMVGVAPAPALHAPLPASSFLIASSAQEKIAAAKAAAEARQAAFGSSSMSNPSATTSSRPQAVAQRVNCPSDDVILTQGSGKSGNMVSKACSAQLNQRRAMKAAEAAQARKIERAKAAARAADNGPGISLPKLPF